MPDVAERISFKSNPTRRQLVNTHAKATSSDLVPNNSLKDLSIIRVDPSREEPLLDIKLQYKNGAILIDHYSIRCEMDLVRAKKSALSKGVFFTTAGSMGIVLGLVNYLSALIEIYADLSDFYQPNPISIFIFIVMLINAFGLTKGLSELCVYKLFSQKEKGIESFLRRKLNEPISLGLSSEQKAKLLLNGASVSEIDEAEDRANVKDALKIAKEQLEAGQISAREHERYIKRIAEAYPEEVELYTAKPDSNKNRGVK
jgi:hypothetical protein